MIEARPATAADADAWQALLAASGAGDFLHDWAWAAVAEHDGEPQRRFVAVEDGEIVAVAAAQRRALPMGRSFWYVPHGPVLDYQSPEAGRRLDALLERLSAAGREDRAIAIKLEPRLERGSPALAHLRGRGLRHATGTLQVGHTRLVDLADDDALLASFDKGTRYGVRRAEREGVDTTIVEEADDMSGIDSLHELVRETQRRAGFPLPSLERYRVVWRALAGSGRAAIVEARRAGEPLASGMVVVEGDRSFYLFSGSRREERGEPKLYASYLMQWTMMRFARDRGARVHDLWGVAPSDADPTHPWYGVGLFKKGFGGREVVWAGSWDLVVDPTLYRLRTAAGILRGWVRGRRR